MIRAGYFSVFFIFFLIFPNVYIDNMGGDGLNLPQNNISLMFISFLIVFFCFHLKIKNSLLVYDKTVILLLLAVLIMFIPILYTRQEWFEGAFWYWFGIFMGFVFYFFIIQLNWKNETWFFYFYAILMIVVVQAFFSFFQLFNMMDWIPYPKISWRPNGIFQQVNVLSSFIATGVALVLSMVLIPEFKLTNRNFDFLRKCFLIFLLLLFSFVIFILKSRIGIIGCIISLLMICTFFFKENKNWATASIVTIMSGFLLAYLFEVYESVGIRDMSTSTFARVEILNSTWEMIKQKPLLGWGAGGFEFSFQHFRLSMGESTELLKVVSHPHNEFLFWWVENGILGVTGFMLILFVGGILFYNGFKDWKYKKNNIAMMLVLVSIPILLHSQTEYVFRLSFLHWYLVIFLLALSNNMCTSKKKFKIWRGLSPAFTKYFYNLNTVFFSLVFIIICYSLSGGMTLSKIEKSKFINTDGFNTLPLVSKLVHRDRYSFDDNMISLLKFNISEDESLLDDYIDWAKKYLKRKIDKSVYFNLISILQFKGNSHEANLYDKEARGLFPQDYD